MTFSLFENRRTSLFIFVNRKNHFVAKRDVLEKYFIKVTPPFVHILPARCHFQPSINTFSPIYASKNYSMTFLIEIGDKNDKSLFTAKRVVLEETIITVTPPFVDILRARSHFRAILNNFRCQYDTIDYFIVFYSKNVLTVTFSR